ncbi:MAG: hypothetical protein ACR2GN_08330 [Bacteroidia bacterium]
MSTKEKLHKLIDQIEDEKLLEGYLALLKQRAKEHKGKLWNSLSKEEKDELIISYEESFEEKNLISNDDVKKVYKK